jgi:hypothetical protein
MESLYQYPRNLKGIALLLLRLSVATLLLLDAYANGLFLVPSALGILLSLIGVGLSIGILTPLCGIAGSIEEITLLLSGRISMPGYCVVSLVLCLVVAIIGAGAYSLDGVLFGRRRVVL